MNRKVFCVVDPNLLNRLGHDFEYDYSLLEAANKRGYEFLALGHKQVEPDITAAMPVDRAFAHTIWDTFPRLARVPMTVGRKLDILLSNLRFYTVLKSRLSAQTISHDWVVFGHMIRLHHLLGWAWWASSLPRDKVPRINLLFRYSAEWFAGSHFTTHAFRLLEEVNRGTRQICVGTDSERLSREYSQFTRLPVMVFPIPHTTHPTVAADDRRPPQSGQPITVVSLGNARDEKGFLEILQAIQLLHKSGQLDGFNFVLQSNTPYTHTPDMMQAIVATIGAIKSLNLRNVRFLDKELSTDAYYQLLRNADVVLLPYWRSIYGSRTSGIFTEALAAGKSVIVTADTWMSDQLKAYPAGLECCDRDPEDLARALLTLRTNYCEYADSAQAVKVKWLEKHNPDAMVEMLVSPASRVGKPSRIAILYPWGELLERQSGASQRVGFLIDYLKNRYAHIWVLAPGRWGEFQQGNVRYSSYRPGRWEAALERTANYLYRRLLYLLTRGQSKDEDFMLWQHHQFRFRPSFLRRVEELAAWADTVLLEYTFWATPVVRACQRENIKVILTNYDVVSNQVSRSPMLKQLTLRAEIEGLKQATHAISVSVTDQQTFQQHGVEVEVIPHAIDTQRHRTQLSREFIHESLERFYGIQIPRQNVCLFVGSYFHANLVAVQSIRQLAAALSPLEAGDFFHFVVAGGCAPSERSRNFIALGHIEAAVLRALYQIADLVLIPLPFGTGASVKTIEAMAYGKPILGTRIGFRGYAVESGVHCVISDNLPEYPTLIAWLLRDPEKRRELGRNARIFAETYDYRRMYHRYVELIEGLDGNGGPVS